MSATRKIFISYRRSDTAGHVGRLYDELVRYFGRERVFMDIDGIAPGANFVDVLHERLGDAAVVLVVMGPRWAGPLDDGQRRIDQDGDFVRLEVIKALAQPETHVIPVLCAGATFPSVDQLPEALHPLALRNAFELSDLRWKVDVRQLQETLQPFLPLEPLVAAGKGWKSPAVIAAVAALLIVLWWAPWKTDPFRAGMASPSSLSSEVPEPMATPEFPGQAVARARTQLEDARDDWSKDAYLSNLEVTCDLSAKCTLHLTMISDTKKLFLNWWWLPDTKGQFHQSAGADPRDPIDLDGVMELEAVMKKANSYGMASNLSSVFLEMHRDRDGLLFPIWLLFPRQMPSNDRDSGFCMEAKTGARVACRNFRG